MSNDADGKVVFEYVGDTTGIDKANEEAEEKIKNASKGTEDEIKKNSQNAEQEVKKESDKAADDVKKASDKTDEDMQKSAASLGSKIKSKLGITSENVKAALGAAGVAAAGFLKDAVSSAAGAEEKTNRLTNLLKNQGMSAKDAGGNIDAFTKKITSMSDYSGGDAKDALTVLTQKGISVGKALNDAGTLANVAAGNNMSLAEAADVVADAYNGKTRALVTLGILSKDEQKNLGDSENASISMADVQDRLNKRFGGAAQEDLKSYSGQVKEANNSWNAAKVQIGTALLPILTTLLGYLAKVLVPVSNFIKEHPKVAAGILGVIAVLGILFGGMSLINTVMGFFNGLMGASAVATAAEGVAASGAATGIWAMLGPILLVVAAIAAVIAITVLVVKHWKEIKKVAKDVWDGVKNITKEAIDWIKNAFNKIIDFFKNNWKELLLFIVNPFAGALALLYKYNAKFRDWVNGIATTVKDGLKTAIDFIKSLPDKALQWGKDMIQGFIDGIKNMVGKVGDAVTGIADKVKSFLHFSVPDEGPLKDFPTWPRDMMQLWGDEISGNDDLTLRAVKKVSGKVANTLRTETISSGKIAASVSGSLSPALSVMSAAPTVIVQSPDVYLDGDKISRSVTQGQYNAVKGRRIR